MTKIKPSDYVLVDGEANEVFFVIGANKTTIALSNALYEERRKCRRIPKRLHKHFYAVIKTYLDQEKIDTL
jgi:hypothetical protein